MGRAPLSSAALAWAELSRGGWKRRSIPVTMLLLQPENFACVPASSGTASGCDAVTANASGLIYRDGKCFQVSHKVPLRSQYDYF